MDQEKIKNIFDFSKLSIGGIFGILLIFDLLSFMSYLDPLLNQILFLLIISVTLIIGWKRPVFAVYMLFLELFIGSKGYLFYLSIGSFSLSLRMGLFITLFLIWGLKFLFKLIQNYRQKLPRQEIFNDYLRIFKTKWLKFYLLLAIALIWGVAWGIINGNGLSNVFFDFNNWIYLLAIIPIFDFAHSSTQLKFLLKMLMASAIFMALKSIVLAYIFSHIFETWMLTGFRWMTDFGLGEVSYYTHGFYRVFIQSQIFCLGAFFLSLISILVYKVKNNVRAPWYFYLILLSSSVALFISFSRSYWVGLFIALSILPLALKKYFYFNWRHLGLTSLILISTLVGTLAITFAVVKAPPKVEIDLNSALSSRLFVVGAAGQSRISQVTPLLEELAHHPIIGSGFGKTITYRSFDPRQMTPANPEGWYTTYAFEWGYLDIILKFGLFGLLIYLWLIYNLVKESLTKIRRSVSDKQYHRAGIVLAILLGMIGIGITHIFSPYLNHPLGIGYLILFNLAIHLIAENKKGLN